MTIIEAINKLDALKFNTYSQNDKVAWLSQLDLAIKRTVLDNHEGNPAPNFTGYHFDGIHRGYPSEHCASCHCSL